MMMIRRVLMLFFFLNYIFGENFCPCQASEALRTFSKLILSDVKNSTALAICMT